MNFSKLFDQITSVRSNQANYQLVVLCRLSQSPNFTSTRAELGEALKEANPTLGKEASYFKSLSCPVWKVLSNKGLITVKDQTVRLNAKLTREEINKVSDHCMEVVLN